MHYLGMFIFYCCYKIASSEHFSSLEDELRTKRQINSLPLVYPYGCTYKFIVGWSQPVPTPDYISLSFAANFQYQYGQFQNISELSRYYSYEDISREQRAADLATRKDERLIFYRAMADMLDSKGFNGHECMLRAICEAAQYPVEEEGLVGEIIHILLTPDYGRTPFDPEDLEWEESMSVYRDAAIAGRQMFSCPDVYHECPEGQGVMELISVLRDE
ncbi:uncharacterized protein LOC113510723 [Galleria mellonella]|uniref:Uncharacterized protein LOC113510723 n=1 Tax=Galleria mellonella TaxID=7137 RepID=A0A6J1WAA5_GALME|nr:uncharacterized protein LOC113510723 [Galleria mellonella]